MAPPVLVGMRLRFVTPLPAPLAGNRRSFAFWPRGPLPHWCAGVALGMAVAVSLGGCADAPLPILAKKPDPTLIEAQAQASPQVNPDVHKRPSPVVVRVYELKSRAAFDAADFISLYEHDKDVLGPEMLARDEFVMNPGESRELHRTPQAETQFVAVLVGFRDLEKARSRALVPVVAHTTNRWQILIEPLSVAIQPSAPSSAK